MDPSFLASLFEEKERVGVLAFGNELGVSCRCPAGLGGCRSLVVLAGVGGLGVLLPPVLDSPERVSPTTP